MTTKKILEEYQEKAEIILKAKNLEINPIGQRLRVLALAAVLKENDKLIWKSQKAINNG